MKAPRQRPVNAIDDQRQAKDEEHCCPLAAGGKDQRDEAKRGAERRENVDGESSNVVKAHYSSGSLIVRFLASLARPDA